MRFLGKILVVSIFVAAMLLSKVSLAEEKDIPLSKVPAKVILAAQEGIKGVRLTEAEIVTKDNGEIFYEIEGRIGKDTYELQITPEGKIIRAGLEDEFEEDDDDDDD